VILRVSESSKHLWAFTNTNQFLSGKAVGCEDALLSGMPGAVIGRRNGVMTLHKGVFIVDSGVNSAKVATKVSALKLEPESTAMVDYRPGQSLLVRILACPAGKQARVRFSVAPDRVLTLSAGQQVTVDLSADKGNIRIINIPLEGYAGSMPREVTGINSQRYKRMCAHIFQSAGTTAVSSSIGNKVLSASTPVCLYGSEGSRFIAADSGRLGILSGRILLHSSAPQVVCTQMGDVYLQKNGIVSLERWQGELRVQCCSAPKSAILVVDHFGVPMSWGIEALLVDRQPTWNDAFPNDGVGRRCFELHNLRATACIIDDFSLPNLLLKGSHFCELRRETLNESKHLRDHLLKTAAALQVVTGYKGDYVTKPPVTANQ
jgi:hypothetical protein